MVDSAFHSYLVDQMSSTKNCLRHGVFLTTISPHSGSALRQMGPILENGHKVCFFFVSSSNYYSSMASLTLVNKEYVLVIVRCRV